MDPLHVSELKASNETVHFHQETLVFDCTALFYVLDEPFTERMREGGVNVANVTFGAESEDWDGFLRNVETGLDKIEANPNMTLALCSADIDAATRAGKVAIIVGTQGAAMIGPDIYRVELLHRLGVRFFGPAYTGATVYCDGCGETRNAGLSFAGKELIECINGLPMLLDLSHVGHQSRLEAAELATHPVCTHSNSYTINANDRNTKDETIRIIAEKGGTVGVCGLPTTVAPQTPSIEHMLQHADHYISVAGEAHVGLGLDFTEAYREAYWAGNKSHKPPKWRVLRPDIFGTVEDFFDHTYPRGFETIRLFPNFTQGLLDRGHSRETAAGILGGNWYRTFKNAVG